MVAPSEGPWGQNPQILKNYAKLEKKMEIVASIQDLKKQIGSGRHGNRAKTFFLGRCLLCYYLYMIHYYYLYICLPRPPSPTNSKYAPAIRQKARHYPYG